VLPELSNLFRYFIQGEIIADINVYIPSTWLTSRRTYPLPGHGEPRHSFPSSTSKLWTGLWSPAKRVLLTESINHCSLRDARATLPTLGCIAVRHCLQAWMAIYTLVAEIAQYPDPSSDFPPDSSAAEDYDRSLVPHDLCWTSPADQIDWDTLADSIGSWSARFARWGEQLAFPHCRMLAMCSVLCTSLSA